MRLNTFLIPYFSYRTPKYILVEVPLVGVVHRLGQVAALVYVVYTMIIGSTWAMASVPLGSTNPWVETGGYINVATNTAQVSTSMAYCSNPANAYNYGGNWLYGTEAMPPICISPNPYEITQKTPSSVFFTTAYIESAEHGFPCVADGTDEATCTQRPGFADASVITRANGQCICTAPSKTYYPLGVEEMEVSFAHFYNTPTLKTGQISGGSVNDGAEHPLETTLIRADGTEKVWNPPSVITIALRDLLASAHHATCEKDSMADERDSKKDGKCATGITLDEANVDVEHDVENTTKFPVTAARIEQRASTDEGDLQSDVYRGATTNKYLTAPPC